MSGLHCPGAQKQHSHPLCYSRPGSGILGMGNGSFWGSISLRFLCPWDLWFWTRHMSSHHAISLICRGKTQCSLIPLVKMTGAPGSRPVTISLCSNPQLGESQEGDGCPLRVPSPRTLYPASSPNASSFSATQAGPSESLGTGLRTERLLDSFEMSEFSLSPDSRRLWLEE